MKISTVAATALRPNRQESKAQITDATARSIIDTEAARREAKTAKLRAARLAQEAEAEPTEAPLKKTRRNAAS